MKKSIVILGALFVSIILFVLIFQLVNPVKDVEPEILKKFTISKELNKTIPCLEECQEEYSNIKSDIHKECVYKCTDIEILKSTSILDSIALYIYMTDKDTAPDFVIKFIYILIWLALWMQTVLLLFSLLYKDFGFLEKYYFHIVDTALNSPPILGVMGTIYSFAIYTTELDGTSDLIEGFKSSFFDAAFTTIIAGFIYIVNLYFKILILRDRDEKK